MTPFTLCGDSYAWGDDEDAAAIGWNAILCELYAAGEGGGGVTVT